MGEVEWGMKWGRGHREGRTGDPRLGGRDRGQRGEVGSELVRRQVWGAGTGAKWWGGLAVGGKMWKDKG